MVQVGILDSPVFLTMDPRALQLAETSVMVISWMVASVSKTSNWP
jgi:hypothetical protein